MKLPPRFATRNQLNFTANLRHVLKCPLQRHVSGRLGFVAEVGFLVQRLTDSPILIHHC